MNIEDLKNRFKKFAINVALLIRELSQDTINRAYCNQLIRSSSSTGADFKVQIEILIKEAGELLAITVQSIKTARSKPRTS